MSHEVIQRLTTRMQKGVEFCRVTAVAMPLADLEYAEANIHRIDDETTRQCVLEVVRSAISAHRSVKARQS